MRRIVMFNRVTADGYFAAPDGNLDWVVPEEEIDKESVAAAPGTDTVLFGHRTYQMFASFWPRFLEDASISDPHDPGRRSPEMKAMGVMLNEAEKVVFSRTPKETAWKNSRISRELDPREIEALKRRPGKDIIIFGSGSIVSQLTEHGLIDDYQFIVAPVLLGKGRQLVTNVPHSRRLRLREAKAYPSGNVTLSYVRATDLQGLEGFLQPAKPDLSDLDLPCYLILLFSWVAL